MRNKSYLCILCLFLLILAGCGQPEAPETTIPTTSSAPETTVPVAASEPETTETAIAVPPYTLAETPAPEDIADIDSFALMLEGEPFFYCDESEAVSEMEDLISGAQWLGYDPQTYYLGVELVLFSNGTGYVVELDLTDDLCRIGDKFYDYGPGMDGEDSIKALPRLWEICGYTEWTLEDWCKWPQIVIDTHAGYFASLLC